MRLAVPLLLGALLWLPSPALPAAEAPCGLWLDEDGSGYIRIEREGGLWHGYISGSVEGTVEKDVHNPDPDKRDDTLLGRRILIDLQREDDVWKGTIYNPRNGKTYSAQVTAEGPNTLNVRGYLGVPMLGQSQTWTRVTDPENAPGLSGDASASD